MLLPVETFHDTDKNVVYTTTDCLGTYCLMDMEMLFKSLGIEPDDSKTPEISEQTLDKAQIIPYNGNEPQIEKHIPTANPNQQGITVDPDAKINR